MTKEEIMVIAEGCDGRTALARKNRRAYLTAVRNGWMDEVCPRKKNAPRKDIMWTFEACIETARKYMNITAFRRERGGAYQVALRHGWLNDIRRDVWGMK